MTEMLVWLMISYSAGYYNAGNITNVAMFKEVSQCEHVLKNLPGTQQNAKCIQAKVLVPK